MLSLEELQSEVEQGRIKQGKKIAVEKVRRISGMSDCWLVTSHYSNWSASRYPRVMYNGQYVDLHRLVKFVEGYDLDPKLTASHLCETRDDTDSIRCIAPDHIVLEPIKDNLRRSPRLQAMLHYGMKNLHKAKKHD